MLQIDRGRKTTSKRTARQVSQANSEPHTVWPPVRKQGRFSSREQVWAVRSDTVPQNRRQALVTKISFWSRNQSRGCQTNQIPQEPCRNLLTKNIFSSRKTLHPSRRCASDGWAASRLPWAGLLIFVKRFTDGRRFFRSAARCNELRPS